MANLFLSYSRKDSTRTQRLVLWLEREGHHVWRDDDDIGGGASFSTEIEKALQDCDAVLVLWSEHSAQSAWVRDEAGYGRDAGKLIPLSLDGREPPLGFRQFQSIDLSKWKGHGEPPTAERIRRSIGRLAANPEPRIVSVSDRAAVKPRWILPRTTAVALLLLIAAAFAGVFLWRSATADQRITISVLPSPTSPDRAAAEDYANVTAADMAAFLPTRFERAAIVPPVDAAGGTSGYGMLIAASRSGNGADASVTLLDTDGHTTIWSKSWNMPDTSAVDLKGEISRYASQAALCLTEARGGTKRLDQPALGLYLSGCVGVSDPNQSQPELLATFERVVKLAPEFPRAWGSVALGRSIYAADEYDRSGRRDAAAVKNARDAIAMATRLDPRSGLAYLAEWHLLEDQPLRQLALLDEAVRAAPDEPQLHARRSDSLARVGRMAESVEEARRAVELDPLSSFTRSEYIVALTYAGQLSKAKADIADARKKWPNDLNIDWAEYGFQYRYGDPRIAEQLLPRVTDVDADMLPNRKIIEARLNPSPANVEEAIAAIRARWGSDPRTKNILLLALGTFGKIADIYALLSDPKFQPFIEPDALFRPEFVPVRADPRFMAVASRLGLVRYWRTSGNWPDFCTNEKLKYDCKTEAAKYV